MRWTRCCCYSIVACVLPSGCNHQRSCSRARRPLPRDNKSAPTGNVTTKRVSVECVRRVASSCSALANPEHDLLVAIVFVKVILAVVHADQHFAALVVQTHAVHVLLPTVGLALLLPFSCHAFVELVRVVVQVAESTPPVRSRKGTLLQLRRKACRCPRFVSTCSTWRTTPPERVSPPSTCWAWINTLPH